MIFYLALMLILGIESTCDEMACAVVRDGKEILSNCIASQADLHAIYGGVVPELACRRHIEVLRPMMEQACKDAGITLQDVDAVAAARGPGLIGAVMIGFNAGKALAWGLGKPFIAIHHIEAHLYAPFMDHHIPLPALGVVVSGGHTTLVKIDEIGSYTLIGETIDDAIGEAFDKVAKMLGLPYPGGPHVERLALQGDPKQQLFKAGRIKEKPYHFSFSGLKTAVLYRLRDQPNASKADIATGFQEAALGDVVKKSLKAAEQFDCQSIVLGGGVTQSTRLKELFSKSKLPLFWPGPELSLDNAAMIAGLAYPQFQRQGGDPLSSRAQPRIALIS